MVFVKNIKNEQERKTKKRSNYIRMQYKAKTTKRKRSDSSFQNKQWAESEDSLLDDVSINLERTR